jgi:hypothetical protein
MELEAENKLLKERESDRARPDFSKDTLPRGPAKLAMKGPLSIFTLYILYI